MKGKAAFIIGAAVGYVLGTRAGRDQFEKIKSGARSALEHPAVKDKVAQAETKINDVVREQGAKVTDQVANMVKERFAGGGTTSSTRPAAGTEDAPSNGPANTWDTPQR